MFIILGGLAALWLVLWLARRYTQAPLPEAHAFTRAEIAGYDSALPKYLLAAAANLLLGGIHGFIVQLPPVRHWLFQAGEPAQLLVDEVRQQLIVAGGGVMLAMGLTCYALPRLIGRPLRNHSLARISFILTLAGLLLSTLTTVTVGLLEGLYVHAGASYAGAIAWLGPWSAFPRWLFEGARDAGFWTFALLVLLTVQSGHHVIWPRHRRNLTRWLVASAAALFVVVGQRVLVSLPGDWAFERTAALALLNGQGYTHLYLILGGLAPIAVATFVYFLERRAERRTDWQQANRILGALVGAALTFYLVRVGLVVYEAYVAPRSGLSPDQAALSLEPWRSLALGLTGLALLVALAVYALQIIRLARAARRYLPRVMVGTLSVGLVFALLAGLHGALLGFLSPRLDDPLAVAHGELALGAVVLLPALTLADNLLLERGGPSATARLSQAGLGFLGAGLLLAYLTGFGLGGPAGPLVAAALQLAGLLAFALHAYQATGSYRHALRARLRFLRPPAAQRNPLAILELPMPQVLLIEFLGALAGFPGLGWLFGGFTLVGALLLYLGPAVAWALLPSILTLSHGPLHQLGWNSLLIYLPASALASSLFLRTTLRRGAEAVPAIPEHEASPPGEHQETGSIS